MTEIPLTVLDQDETWIDAAGTVHQIADMDASYCRNVIAFLQRRADEIAVVRGLTLANCRLPDEDSAAYLIVTESIDRETELLFADPAAWLNAKQLIKALRKRAQQGD